MCHALAPLNGENLDDAQRPLRAKLWRSPVGEEFLMRREDSGAALAFRDREEGRKGWRDGGGET